MARTAFVVARPEALATGRAADLVDWLEREFGVVPFAVRARWLPASLLAQLYRRKLDLVGPGQWLQARIHEQHPAAALLLVGGPDVPSLSRHLQAAKGTSSPAAPPEGSSGSLGSGGLRAAFGRQSSFHSVLHNAEDEAAVMAEATLVFPWEDVAAAADAAADVASAPTVPRAALRALVAAQPADASVYEVALDVQRRLAAALVVGSGGHLRSLAEARLEALSEARLPAGPLADQRDAYLELARRHRPALDALVDEAARAGGGPCDERTPRSPLARWRRLDREQRAVRLATAAGVLGGLDHVPADEGEAVLDVIDRYDVPLTPWWRSLVAAGLAADLDPEATFLGARLWPLDGP